MMVAASIGRSVTLLRGGHGKGIEAKVLQNVAIRRRSVVRLGVGYGDRMGASQLGLREVPRSEVKRPNSRPQSEQLIFFVT